MSDYFDHLAAIALGTAPSLSPRTASRFEPAATVELALDLDPMAEQGEPAPPPARMLDVPPAAAFPESPRPPRGFNPSGDPSGRVGAASPLPEPTVPGNRQAPDTPAPERPGANVAVSGIVSRGQAPPAPPGIVRTTVRRGDRHTPLVSHRPEPATDAPIPAELGSILPGAQTGPDQATPAGISPRAPSGTGSAAGAPPRTVSREHPTGQSDHDAPPRAVVLEPPPGRVAPPVPGTRAEARQAATAPPTIQVTIGRVEVRAVQPPAPVHTPRPAAKPPALTLDDYLAARDGGSS